MKKRRNWAVPIRRVRRKSAQSRISLTKFLCTSRSLRSALGHGRTTNRTGNKIGDKKVCERVCVFSLCYHWKEEKKKKKKKKIKSRTRISTSLCLRLNHVTRSSSVKAPLRFRWLVSSAPCKKKQNNWKWRLKVLTCVKRTHSCQDSCLCLLVFISLDSNIRQKPLLRSPIDMFPRYVLLMLSAVALRSVQPQGQTSKSRPRAPSHSFYLPISLIKT